MTSTSVIIRTAFQVRILLWLFVLFVLLCVLGVPTLVDVEIEPLKNSSVITLGYILSDYLYPPVDMNYMDVSQLSRFQLFSFTGLFVCSLMSLSMLVWTVDRLFRQYSFGHIFTSKNIKYFFMIGWSLVALFVFTTLSDNLLEQFLLQQSYFLKPLGTPPALSLSENNVEEVFLFFISLDFSLLIAGLFVIAVARVMQVGMALQEDVDATV